MQVIKKEFIDTTWVGTVTTAAVVKGRLERIVFWDVFSSLGLMIYVFPVSKIRKKEFRVVLDEEENDLLGSCKVIDKYTEEVTLVAHETKNELREVLMREGWKNGAGTAAVVTGTQNDDLWHNIVNHISDVILQKSLEIK